MENLYLKLIDLSDKQPVLDFVSEMVAAGSEIHGLWDTDELTFEDMLNKLKNREKIKFDRYEQEELVHFQYLLYRKSDNKLLGTFSLRPFPTSSLDAGFGGNIGYSVRPSERRKGYATAGLKLAIEALKKINDTKVFVCCDTDNIASKKVILKNGGKLVAEKIAIVSHQKYIVE